MKAEAKRTWWQDGVIYQIYPRSFQDSNGDGIGDLNGIRRRLPYLHHLGVDAIWISPIYPSPMADFGYDVADYIAIDPLFGTLADFDQLLAEAHQLGIRVILDFVPNHTSDEHPWFVESRSSKENPKRDWYLWRDPAPGGGPPNNWRSAFGGPAWKFDETTGQYFYHAFLDRQPDLNWRNPEVREAMAEVLRFWLKRGVDGFRVDVIWHLLKDEEFRDNPANPEFKHGLFDYDELLPVYTTDHPEVHGIIRELRAVVDGFEGNRLLIGEIYLPLERLIRYYGNEGTGVHLPYNFQLIVLPWSARAITAAISNYEALLPEYAWPNWVLGNHDKPRVASRIGAAQARVAAMLLLTLRGTPTIYYGDELGMEDVPIPPDLVQDPFEKNVPGRGLGRDPARTPMQWSAEPEGAFTTGRPWLPLAADLTSRNVETQSSDPHSMLTLHRRLLALRRLEPALHDGSWSSLEGVGDVIAYARRGDASLMVVLLNLGDEPTSYPLAAHGIRGEIILSTHLDRENEAAGEDVALRAAEGLVIRVA
jgi:alpha-glucosidase